MDKLKMLAAMLIFGTIGIFVSFLPLPSAVVACARSCCGTVFLLAVFAAKRTALRMAVIRQNAALLLASGFALGFNWILLFESYRYTGVPVGTLCYYMAPVFTVLLSPIVLHEKLTAQRIACTALAVLGAVLISGLGSESAANLRGIAYGLCAAALYCAIVLMNKKTRGLAAMETTFCQLAVSAVVMLVYVLATQDIATLTFAPRTLVLLGIVGIVHTGLAYLLFFSSAASLPAQTTALLSYVDPVTALLLAYFILHQPMNGVQTLGAVLILGSTLLSELPIGKRKNAHS